MSNRDDFLENYMIYTSGNEVPKNFHLWAGIGALSCLVSRRVWMDFGFFENRCNMYITLVGKPADKKSTAMHLARALVQRCGVKVGPDGVTKERICQLMSVTNKDSKCNYVFTHNGEQHKASHLSLFCNEMVTLLSSGGNALGMIEFLTDIWDKPMHEIDTKHQGNDVIIGPYLTILACMTPDQTASLMKQEIITGGFSRRCLFILPEGRGDPVAFPKLQQHQIDAREKCFKIGNQLKQVIGEFTFTPEAEAFWVSWYNSHHAEKFKPHPAVVLYFLETMPRYVIQLSMLLSLSSNRTNFILEKKYIERAIELITPLQLNLPKVFIGAGRNVLSTISAKIISELERSEGPMPVKVLQAQLWDHANTTEFTDALQFLVKTNKIKEVVRTGGIAYDLPTKSSSGPNTASGSSTLPPPNLG